MRIGLALAVAFALLPLSPATAAAVPAAPDAAAQISPSAKAAELDSLFAALKSVSDESDARVIETRIQDLWLDSGDVEVDRLMDCAIAAVNAGAYTLAIGYRDSIVLRAPDYAEGWNKRATVYWLMGSDDHSFYVKSLADVDRTLKLEPRHWGALAGRGMIMRDLGEDKQAVAAFRQSLAIDPGARTCRSACDCPRTSSAMESRAAHSQMAIGRFPRPPRPRPIHRRVMSPQVRHWRAFEPAPRGT
jgi:tetratricopeptide (TPR) repeat protein